MRPVVFLHAADLHLDSPFTGLKSVPKAWTDEMRESPFKAFRNIIGTAIEQKVDFMLLSGDLFDGENRSLRTQVKFRREMERLKAAGIPVYIIHGNHDHLGGAWIHVDFPDNVHVFSEKTEMKLFQKSDGTLVHLYGFSYPKRHVTERMIDTYAKIEGADYHIGLLHGNLEGVTTHSPYAPFTLRDLTDKHFDYWALGHIHKREIISEQPLAIYPGNIQGRNRKENGEKGCYLIELNGSDWKQQFIRTSEVIWDTVTVTISEGYTFDAILAECKHILMKYHPFKEKYLLDLILDGRDGHDSNILREDFLDDVLSILQEQAEDEEWNVWPYRITFHKDTMPVVLHDTPFTSELLSKVECFTEYDEALNPLYRHGIAKKWLDSLTEEEQGKILKDAKRMLLQMLQ
ncbi:metallophosphoesterase family protein [Bacillus cihuensis]|uniref:metallophosphoesterase family protein n=1 Tax=Bacillus cihuensis TaxID=1208599 RepID=UPI00042777B8|nr:DNA repair exonuclease [Bacillus cihuensis]